MSGDEAREVMGAKSKSWLGFWVSFSVLGHKVGGGINPLMFKRITLAAVWKEARLEGDQGEHYGNKSLFDG